SIATCRPFFSVRRAHEIISTAPPGARQQNWAQSDMSTERRETESREGEKNRRVRTKEKREKREEKEEKKRKEKRKKKEEKIVWKKGRKKE
uniref:hypothetical protein n=1 Tax=Salmonella enterica TaxID=28901 RepID=UPI00398C5A10